MLSKATTEAAMGIRARIRRCAGARRVLSPNATGAMATHVSNRITAAAGRVHSPRGVSRAGAQRVNNHIVIRDAPVINAANQEEEMIAARRLFYADLLDC